MSKLSEWVKAQPATVAELAAELGVGRVALHRYMNGRAMPRPAMVAKIEALTGGAVTAADLNAAYAA